MKQLGDIIKGIIYTIWGSFWLYIFCWIVYRLLFKIYRWLAI